MYIYKLSYDYSRLQDLNPLFAGEKVCTSLDSIGPVMRCYTKIVYVLKGKGTLCINGILHTVEAGQAFLIPPGETATYTADAQDPWHIQWISFGGNLSTDFAVLPPVFSLQGDIFYRAFRSHVNDISAHHLASILFQLYDTLHLSERNRNTHVHNAMEFIHTNYMHTIRVQDVANHLNLDRSHLSRLFLKTTGTSVKDYLLKTRMKEAANYLRQGHSVNETAAHFGYKNATNFANAFKKFHGILPSKVKMDSKDN